MVSTLTGSTPRKLPASVPESTSQVDSRTIAEGVEGLRCYLPPMGQDDGIERILVVMAHPDDVDFGAAGSVATWTDAGIEVVYCLATDGDAGGHDLTVPRDEMVQIRRAEQTTAAKVVGVTELHFLGHPDGRLEPTLDLRRDISRVIRRVRPQRVLSQSPERSFERMYASHPDHLAAGEATLCAVYPDSRNPFAFPELLEEEGLEPWTVSEVWMMTAREQGVFVDATDVFDRKLEALRSHASQHQDPDGLEPLLRNWMGANAEAAGFPPGRLAEAFYRIVTT
jgi:LmbE family N-acetylglucosaminyl deacetylase